MGRGALVGPLWGEGVGWGGGGCRRTGALGLQVVKGGGRGPCKGIPFIFRPWLSRSLAQSLIGFLLSPRLPSLHVRPTPTPTPTPTALVSVSTEARCRSPPPSITRGSGCAAWTLCAPRASPFPTPGARGTASAIPARPGLPPTTPTRWRMPWLRWRTRLPRSRTIWRRCLGTSTPLRATNRTACDQAGDSCQCICDVVLGHVDGTMIGTAPVHCDYTRCPSPSTRPQSANYRLSPSLAVSLTRPPRIHLFKRKIVLRYFLEFPHNLKPTMTRHWQMITLAVLCLAVVTVGASAHDCLYLENA
jgi:hypothetical protein